MLSCHFAGDHLIFAVVLVFLFVILEYMLHYHWAAKPTEVVLGATIHRLLFGGQQ